MLWLLLAVVIVELAISLVAGARERAAVSDAATRPYRSLTGDGGHDISRQATWGDCAAVEMTDGRTAVLVKRDSAWLVVRHLTYTDGYDLDSVDSSEECHDIATRPQAPSYP